MSKQSKQSKQAHKYEHINEVLNEIMNVIKQPLEQQEQPEQPIAINLPEDDEKTDEQYDREIQLIDEMFPNAEFAIAVGFENLEHKITDKKFIIVKSDYDCYCYDLCNKPPDYFYIHGENMTYRYVLEQLIKQGLTLECNHRFVEIITQIGDSNVFEIWTGS